MSRPTRVRDIQQEDIEQIAKMEELIFRDSWSEASLKSTIDSEHGSIVLCDDGCSVLGYMIYYCVGDEIELARIATTPEARGKWIGSRMMDHLIDLATSEKKVRILLEVRMSNFRAINFYNKFEFASIGIRKNYYSNPVEDGNIMEKVLEFTDSI